MLWWWNKVIYITHFCCGINNMSISKIIQNEFIPKLWTYSTVFPCVSGVVQERRCTPLPRRGVVAPSWQKVPSSAGVGAGNCRPVQRHLVPCHCDGPQVAANNARRTCGNRREMDRCCSGSDKQHVIFVTSNTESFSLIRMPPVVRGCK